MTIQWASDKDGDAIKALLQQEGLYLEGGNWTGLGKTWLVSKDKSQVQACIAYHPGRPFARLDFLSISQKLGKLSKVRVLRDIIEAALAVSALHGSSFVTGVVPYYLPEYGEILAKRGGKSVNEGWIFMAPLVGVLERQNRVNGWRKINTDHNGNKDS